jgi:hypothetical protein
MDKQCKKEAGAGNVNQENQQDQDELQQHTEPLSEAQLEEVAGGFRPGKALRDHLN